MTRTDAIAILADAASATRKDLVAALKAVDAYSGHSRDGLADLITHAEATYAAVKPVEPKAEPKAKDPNRGLKAAAASRAVTPRAATIRKVAALVANATAGEDGAIVVTTDDLVAVGLGASWVRISNARFADPESMDSRVLAAVGYTGQTTRGTLVLTPMAAEESAEQAG